MDVLIVPMMVLCSECGKPAGGRTVPDHYGAVPHSIEGMCSNERCVRYEVVFRVPLVRVTVEPVT